jgi:hypothetical protein
MSVFSIVAASVAVPFLISLTMLGRFERMMSKVAALFAVCLVLPILLYSAWFALTTYGHEGNFWGWWMTGIVMLSPVFGGWVIGAFFGAFLSRHFAVTMK